MNNPSGPSTLRRGLRVLDVLREAGPDGLHVLEVAQAAGVQRSTVYRFLDVLIEMGYAERDPATRRYRALTPTAPAAADAHQRAVERWAPAMRRISDETGDSTFLICRAGHYSLCLHREIGHHPVQVLSVTVGHRQPLGVGAAGLALLAALPADEAQDVIAQNTDELGRYGRMTPARLRSLVKASRSRGWSVVGDSAVPNVMGVGIPIRDAAGRPVLAVSVTSLMARMPVARQRRIAELLRSEIG